MLTQRQLDAAVRYLLSMGTWEPEAIHLRILGAFPRVHYSRVRETINKVKSYG